MRLVVYIFLLAVIYGCKESSKIPEKFDYGKIEDGKYTNEYFEFEIPIPDKWIVQSRDQVKQIQKEGEDSITKINKELAIKVKESDISSAILLTVFKYRTDTTVNEFNPSFTILVENLGDTSRIKTGVEYLAHAKAMMQESGISYNFPSGFYSETLGNKVFSGMDISMNLKGADAEQSYYSAIDKSFAISIIISFVGDKQKEELKNIINGIRFK